MYAPDLRLAERIYFSHRVSPYTFPNASGNPTSLSGVGALLPPHCGPLGQTVADASVLVNENIPRH